MKRVALPPQPNNAEFGFLSLPSELKSEIERLLPFAANRRLQLVDRQLLALGWLQVPEIELPYCVALETFLDIPSAQLANLESLSNENSFSLAESEELLLSICDLPRLSRLCLRGVLDDAQLFFPAALQSLTLETHSYVDGPWLLKQICNRLNEGLRKLDFSPDVPFYKLSILRTMKRLESIRMEHVTDIPEEATKVIAALRRYLPPSIRFEDLHIRHINGDEIFTNVEGEEMDTLRDYYDLGFRISSRIDRVWMLSQRPKQFLAYVREGWINPATDITSTAMRRIVDKKMNNWRWEAFVEGIFLPILQAKAAALGGIASDAEYRRLSSSILAFRDARGVELSLLAFASQKFLDRFFQSLDRLHFDIHATYGGKPLTYFIQSARMKAQLGALGLVLPASEEEKALDFAGYLQRGWKAQSGEELRGGWMDMIFYFDRCFALPHYFAANTHKILHTCLDRDLSGETSVHVVATLLGAKEFGPLTLALDLSWGHYNVFQSLVGSGYELNYLGYIIFSAGAENFFSVLPRAGPFASGQNALHVIGQFNRFLRPDADHRTKHTLEAVINHLPAYEPMAYAADADGKFPLFYWIHLGFCRPRLKPALERLITYYRVGPIDVLGTTLRAHCLRSALFASTELISSHEDPELQELLNQAALFQSTLRSDAEVEAQAEQILEIYHAVVEEVFDADCSCCRAPLVDFSFEAILRSPVQLPGLGQPARRFSAGQPWATE